MPAVVINASAGSGKTYRLAIAYLGALLLPTGEGRPPRPEQVLATTFTRAAASEILERVFRLLAEAVVLAPKRKLLLRELGRPELTQADLSTLLLSLCQALPRLQVGTLDGLFARVVRVLGTDLAFPTAWTVADEVLGTELALAAADRLLREPHVELVRAQWRRYAQFKPGTRVRAALADLLEDHRFPLLEAAIAEDDPSLEEPLRLTAEEAAEIARDLESFADIPLTAKGQPHKWWERDLAGLKTVFAGEVALIDLMEETLVRLALQEDARHRAHLYPPSLRKLLGPAAARAAKDLHRLHQGRLPALAALARRYHDFRRIVAFSAAAYRFPEIEAAARVLPPHLHLNDLYFRLDGQVSHLLLDEFQDTSESQFRFLRPLIDEILASGRLFFAVGDVKQSIYGWRGASRRLFKQLPELFTPRLSTESLDTNYRSSPAVLQAVDRVFGKLASLACLDPGSYKETDEARRARAAQAAAAEFTEGYAPHLAAGANRTLPGCVRLIITEKAPAGANLDDPDEAEKYSGEIDAVLLAVERHLEEDPQRQVAVLCRRRSWIPELIAKLRWSGIDASGEGGSPVTDSAAVELILSLLTWLDHPGHTLAAEHVRRSGMMGAFGLVKLLPDDVAVRSIRIALMRRGLAENIAEWIRHPAFLQASTGHDQVRCEQLVELARRAPTGTGGLSRFVARARSQRLENPISARVRIMTIHGSKGLEFDAVILADLRGGGGAGKGPRFVNLSGPGQPDALELLPTREHADIMGLQSLYERHDQLLFEEELSVLYVGLTRARSFLDVVIPRVEKEKPSLPCLLCEAWESYEPGEHLIETFAGKRTAGAEPKPALAPDPAVWRGEVESELPLFTSLPERLDSITPSSHEGAGRVPLGLLLKSAPAQALERGTAVHALLARVEWAHELPALPAWLADIPASEASPAACRRAATSLRRRLVARTDTLHAIFDQGTWLEHWRESGVVTLALWRERRFSVVLGNELMNGTFDRVVIGREAQGACVRAAILDFKTDRIEGGEEREARRQFYQPQLEAYATALRRMVKLPADAIETRLVWIE